MRVTKIFQGWISKGSAKKSTLRHPPPRMFRLIDMRVWTIFREAHCKDFPFPCDVMNLCYYVHHFCKYTRLSNIFKGLPLIGCFDLDDKFDLLKHVLYLYYTSVKKD